MTPQNNNTSPSVNKLLITRFLPVIGAATVDSVSTYFPNALIVRLQSDTKISVINASKQQLKLGIYYGHLDYYKFRLLSRVSAFTGLQLMSAYNIKNNFKNDSICAVLSGMAETIITNQHNAKNRLTLINKIHIQKTINSMLIPCGIKNIYTYLCVFNMRTYYGPILHKKTGISLDNSLAITSAVTAMAIQPSSTILDNMCTIQLRNTHDYPNKSLWDITKLSLAQAYNMPLFKSINLVVLRTLSMGLSYFIMDRASKYFVNHSLSFYDRFEDQDNYKPKQQKNYKNNDFIGPSQNK